MRKETTNLVFDKIESKVNLKLSKPKIIQFSLNGSFCFTASLLLLWLCAVCCRRTSLQVLCLWAALCSLTIKLLVTSVCPEDTTVINLLELQSLVVPGALFCLKQYMANIGFPSLLMGLHTSYCFFTGVWKWGSVIVPSASRNTSDNNKAHFISLKGFT